MMKTVVTGSDGLVGSAIRRLKPKDTIFLSRKDVDLTNFDKTKKVFQKIKPKRVIHLAAEVAGIGGNLMHSGEYFRNNILINTNVLESARLSGVEKLISYMSTCVFPDKTSYPLKEKNIHKGPPHSSNFGYAYAKRMLEVQSRAYRNEWGCNYIVAIPTNLYGPNDFYNDKEGHVIPSLIKKCYLAKVNKTDLNIWGSGKSLREFVLADDIAKLSFWLMENYDDESPIILSSGEEISIKDLVDLIVKLMKFKGKVNWDKDKPDGQFRKPSDTTKLRNLLPRFRFTSIDTGLRKTISWFEKNYPRVRD